MRQCTSTWRGGETEGVIEITQKTVEAATDILLDSGLMRYPKRSTSSAVRKF